jgi:hypothetical protein
MFFSGLVRLMHLVVTPGLVRLMHLMVTPLGE